MRTKTFTKRRIFTLVLFCFLTVCILAGRLSYIMFFKSDELQKLADSLHERERAIKAKRGNILDTNGVPIAQNKPVNTISIRGRIY